MRERIKGWLFSFIASPMSIQALLGTIFFWVGLIAFYLAGQTYNLNCNRVNQNLDCKLTTTWMNLSTLRTRDFSQLQSAWLDESCDDDGCSYRVILETRRGAFPVTDIYNSDQGTQQEFADQINAFVNDKSQTEMKIQTPISWAILVPIAFISAGLYYLAIYLINLLMPGKIKLET